jgi:hypothetical protein
MKKFVNIRSPNCPTVTLNGNQIPQGDTAKYLGVYFDRRLTYLLQDNSWGDIPTNVLDSRKKVRVINRKQNYSKAHLDIRYTPWGTDSNSNTEILQSYQNKVLRTIVNAPWYISNTVLRTD